MTWREHWIFKMRLHNDEILSCGLWNNVSRMTRKGDGDTHFELSFNLFPSQKLPELAEFISLLLK